MKIVITVAAEAEDITPERSERLHRFAAGFATAARAMMAKAKALDPKSRWGWCSIKVQATIDGVDQGTEYLGGSSYLSEDDFVANSSYFDDMVKSAINEAVAARRQRIAKAAAQLNLIQNH
jgi:hypothetical protein